MYQEQFNYLLTDTGTDAGDPSAANNYASLTHLYRTALPGFVLRVESLTIFIADGGALVNDGYGSAAALANGVNFVVSHPDHDELPSGFALLSQSIIRHETYLLETGAELLNRVDSTGVSVYCVRLNFTSRNSAGAGSRQGIIVPEGYRFSALLNDDFSGLEVQLFSIAGSIARKI